jgi:NhaA family Na+:H+ antiporter
VAHGAAGQTIGMSEEGAERRLLRPFDRERDHARGGAGENAVDVVVYGDYLCPYCRRLRRVLERLRRTLGSRMVYVFRHFPNERAHPGATLLSRAAEAAGDQGKFWEMHDALYDHDLPVGEAQVREMVGQLHLDEARFAHDLASPETAARVDEDLADGRANDVKATPTIYIDGARYDGAWDFHAMLEAVDKPVGARVRSTARAFASLPASAGLVLLIAAVAALAFDNSPLASLYQGFVNAPLGIGPPRAALTLTVSDWLSDGLLSVFFLLVGLEIRREMTSGALTDWRAALLPVVAAVGGTLGPAAIYLALNPGPTAGGWSIATATNIAFALGVLAVLGKRAGAGLKVFVAAYSVMDDILSILILAIFYPRDFHPVWLIAAALAVAALATLNRWRVYTIWPYLVVTAALWLSLHTAGVEAALAGVLLAVFLPTRPAPSAAPLLAQAATALSELEHAERELRRKGDETRRLDQEPVWEWASRNLSAAADRLLSPAESVERAVAPWSNYLVLPLFAFSAAGIPLAANVFVQGGPRVLAGVILGLAVGKPLGIGLASLVAVKAKIALAPEGVTATAFLGAACLCGFGDTFSLLMADQAFPHGPYAAIAKIGVLGGSVLSAALGVSILYFSPRAGTKTR